jgi:hypothetical protein
VIVVPMLWELLNRRLVSAGWSGSSTGSTRGSRHDRGRSVSPRMEPRSPRRGHGLDRERHPFDGCAAALTAAAAGGCGSRRGHRSLTALYPGEHVVVHTADVGVCRPVPCSRESFAGGRGDGLSTSHSATPATLRGGAEVGAVYGIHGCPTLRRHDGRAAPSAGARGVAVRVAPPR